MDSCMTISDTLDPGSNILVERRGHIGLVLLNRPEKLNAINGSMATYLESAARDLEAAHEIRACIIASTAPHAFCAGADLNASLGRGRSASITPTGGFAGFCGWRRAKPWIAAIEGPAVGGGLELALACDMIVASETASLGLPEVRRGLIAGAGGAWMLPRRIPAALALEMLATGDAITGKRAYEIGLSNRLTAPGAALDIALDLATRIAEASPLAVRETLRLARTGETSLDRLHALSEQGLQAVRETPDAWEGPRAFLERRPPVWMT